MWKSLSKILKELWHNGLKKIENDWSNPSKCKAFCLTYFWEIWGLIVEVWQEQRESHCAIQFVLYRESRPCWCWIVHKKGLLRKVESAKDHSCRIGERDQRMHHLSWVEL